MTKTIKRYNSDAYSIWNGGTYFGSVLKLTNGKWKIVDDKDVRIRGTPLIDKPKDALKWV